MGRTPRPGIESEHVAHDVLAIKSRPRAGKIHPYKFRSASGSSMSLKSSFQVGTTRTRPASTKWRRLFLMTALVGLSVTMAAVFYWVSAPRFTGFRVLAPSSACWRGSISGGIRQFTNVSGCGSTSLPEECVGDFGMGATLEKMTPGNWTLTIEAYIRGMYREGSSVSGEYARPSIYIAVC